MRTKRLQSKFVDLLFRSGSPLAGAKIDVISALETLGFSPAGFSNFPSLQTPQGLHPKSKLATLLKQVGNSADDTSKMVEYYGIYIVPPLFVARLDVAALRTIVDFFALHLRNAHTRKAYAQSIGSFFEWCKKREITSLSSVSENDVQEYLDMLVNSGKTSAARQRLSAIRHFYTWLGNGKILPNPAAFVKVTHPSV